MNFRQWLQLEEEDKKKKKKETKTKEIVRAADGTALTTVVLDVMKSRHGEFSNYPLEAKKAKHIVGRAVTLYPDRVEGFLNAILGCYWKQTQTGKVLKGKPFTPATLDTEWIWAENFEAFRKSQTESDTVIKEQIF